MAITSFAISNDTGTSLSDQVTNDRTLTLSGTFPTLNVSIDITLTPSVGAPVTFAAAATTDATTGAFTYVVPYGLFDGDYVISVTDSVTTVSDDFTIDTVTPFTPSAPDLDAGSDTGDSSLDNITSDARPDLTGTAEANSLVTITFTGSGGPVTRQVTADGSGVWLLATGDYAADLADGVYEVSVTATDTAGNVSIAGSSLSITVDTTDPTAPSVPDLLAADDSGISDSDNITFEVRPTLSGTALAGATVDILFNGTGGNDVTVSTVVRGSGQWEIDSFDYAADLSADSYAVTVTVTDTAGNSATGSALSLVVDDTAPAAPTGLDLAAGSDTGTSATDNTTSDTTPEISGTAEANATVSIRVAGTEIATVTANGSGNWTYTFTTPLTDGTAAITAVATDVAGLTGGISSALSVLVDTTAPGTTPTLDATISTDSGVSATDGITSDTTPTVTGTSVANGRVEILLDGVSNGFATANGSGVWTYTFSALAEGTFAVTARDVDLAGNAGTATSALSLVIDTTAPGTMSSLSSTITTDTGASDSDRITRDPTPTITGGSTSDRVEIFVGGVSNGFADVTAGAWTYTFASALPEGVASITVANVDAAGNAGTQSTAVTVTVDTIAPGTTPTLSATIADDTGSSSMDRVTSDNTPTITGTATGDRVEIFADGVSNGFATVTAGAWSYTFAALANGEYDITVADVDTAGNAGTQTTAVDITIDAGVPSTVPTVDATISTDSGVSATDRITADTTPTITGTSVANGRVEILLDGVSNGFTTANGSGVWTYTFSTLVEGTFAVTARDVDLAGNAGTATSALSLVIDTTAPGTTPTRSATITDDTGESSSDRITSDTTPTITGTSTSDRVEIFVGGVSNGFATVTAGAWSYTFASALAEGVASITVADVDTAGNAGTQSTALTVTVDLTAPGTTPTLATTITADTGASTTDEITSDTTPTVSGTATGSRVAIFVDGVLDGFAAVNSSAWSYTFAGLADGEYDITAADVDAAGNTGTPTTALAITVDAGVPSTVPTVDATISTDSGVSGTDRITSDTTPTITGTSVANGRVEILLDGVSNGFATANGSGVWAYTFSTLAEGTFAVTARDVDLAGNAGTATSALSLVIDITAPGTTPTLSSTITDDTGESDSDRLTSDALPTITGTGVANGRVEIFVDGVSNGFASVDSGGAWTYTFSSALTDGDYDVTAANVDTAGNAGTQTGALSFNIDTVAPGTAATLANTFTTDSGTSASDGITNDTTPTISGSSSNDRVQILVDGVSVGFAEVNSSSWTYTFSALADGEYDITVADVDGAGNIGTQSATLTISVDATAPSTTPTLDSFSSDTGFDSTDGLTADNTSLVVEGTTVADGLVEILVGGVSDGFATADGSGAWLYNVSTLADGVAVITVRAVDIAGNAGAESAALSITIDATPPSTTPTVDSAISDDTGVDDEDLSTNDVMPTVTGTTVANGRVRIAFDGNPVGTAVADGDGHWSYTFTTALPEGLVAITAADVDDAGNEGSESAALSIEIDTTAPVDMPTLDVAVNIDTGNSATDGVTSDATPTITGTATGDLVEIFVDGVSVGFTVPAFGGWTYTFDALTDGDYVITAAALDQAGNAGPAAEDSIALTIDTTAPLGTTSPLVGPGDDTGDSDSDGITSETTPTIGGFTDADVLVEVFLDGISEGIVTADSDGFWQFELPSQTDGTVDITARLIDLAGNVGELSETLTLTIDTLTPDAPSTPDLASESDSGDSASDDITNDDTPIFTGTAEAGARVNIYRAGGTILLGSATADGDGDWSFMADPFVSAGTTQSETISARTVDAAGNESDLSAELTVTFDLEAIGPVTAPELDQDDDTGVDDEDGITNQTSFDLVSFGVAETLTYVYINGEFFTGIYSDADGDIRVGIDDEDYLDDGTYTVYFTQVDVAGNESAADNIGTFTLDTSVTAPDFNLATGSDTGIDDADRITRERQPTIVGTSEANATIEVFVNEILAGTTTADGDGNWSYEFTSDVPTGAIEIVAVATDVAGNVSGEPVFTLFVDIDAPDAPTVALTNDSGFEEDDFYTNVATIGGTLGDDDYLRIEFGDEIELIEGDGGVWSYTPPDDLADGEYTVLVRSIDVAGNESDAVEVTFTVDTTGPSTTPTVAGFTQTTDGDADAEVTITGTGEAGSFVLVRDGTDELGFVAVGGDGNWSFSANLDDGTYAFTAQAFDAAGNGSGESGPLSVTVSSTSSVTATRYEGPVAGLDWQFIGGTETDVFTATADDDFVNLGAGDDAVNGGAGNDVLDGGTGSNFLTGGSGGDVFFTDARNVASGAATWSTVSDYSAEDQLNVFGWRPGTSTFFWVENAGAPGFTGATIHMDIDNNGRIDTSVTFSGLAVASIDTPLSFDGLLWFL